MRCRQTVPVQWVIVTDSRDWEIAKRVPRGGGVLLLKPLHAKDMRRLRQIARQKELIVVSEGPRTAARAHNCTELRTLLLRRTPMILLSPLFPTATHPDWKPLARLRAATLARLARGKLIALGGMDARKFARIRHLGFQGWAGISAFRT
jgi:thiamine-phosphate pyrophosphorylase